jgi:hypothetical protein
MWINQKNGDPAWILTHDNVVNYSLSGRRDPDETYYTVPSNAFFTRYHEAEPGIDVPNSQRKPGKDAGHPEPSPQELHPFRLAADQRPAADAPDDGEGKAGKAADPGSNDPAPADKPPGAKEPAPGGEPHGERGTRNR